MNTPEYTFPRIAVTLLLINPHNEVFLLRRSKQTRNDQGLWSIPGGAIEKGETVTEAMIRECQEETGVIIKNPAYIGYIDHIMPELEQHWVSHVFIAREWEGEATNTEPIKCDEVGWFPVDNLPEDRSVIVHKAMHLRDISVK